MKSKHYDLIIPKDGDEPFVNCKLNRKQYAEVLTDIVGLYSDGFVLAVNNKWGTGKTTFIKMWEQHLKNKDFKTLYFNAWENDFQSDVLVALLAELEVLADSNTEAGFKKVLSKATPLLKKVGLGLVKGLAKKVGADEMLQAIIEGTAEATLDGLEDEIKSYTNRKKGIQDFRKTLKAYAKLLGNGKPIVFIIDELDRCRPSYAVEVLEQVKHLFSVKGIVFVLVIDKEQLGHAIRGVYGSDRIDANEYLRRFIDLEYSIPKPDIENYCRYLYEYFELGEFFKSQERVKHSELQQDEEAFLNFTKSFFPSTGLTLRQIEKVFVLARTSLLSFDNNVYVLPAVFIFLIYIKISDGELYEKISNKELSIQEFVDKIECVFPKNLIGMEEYYPYISLDASLLSLYNNYLNEGVYANKFELLITKNSLINLNFNSKMDNSENYNELVNSIQSFGSGSRNMKSMKISHLVNKINLMDVIK